ncbi:Pre-mRNA-splicing factor SPF27, partial [Coemansia sp. RSA 1933]
MDSQNVVIESLPYIDKDYDEPATRQTVLQMVQDEMSTMAPPELPRDSTSLFKGKEILRKEYERVRSGTPLPAFDVSRYKLEPPSGSCAENVDEWKRACDNAAAQLEHQDIRLVNLELLQQFGANA